MPRTAVVAGVGPGLGAALARRFVTEGCQVGLFARSEEFLTDLADELGSNALAVPTDVTDPEQVRVGFDRVRETFGPVDVLVNHASAASWDGTLDVSHESFGRALDTGPKAALYCSQEAVSDMLGDEGGTGGTVVFTGATTSKRGRDGAIGFSAAKFACRGMAESMARELGPQGVHVAHVVIDGGVLTPSARGETVDDEQYLDPDAIAESYWHLVEQDRSAWTLELDVRPHVEEF